MWDLIVQGLGGLALFLLAMRMMTNGLKLFAGGALRDLLAGWTSTPVRGAATGALVTGLLQSSSAVTVATIGFVNAGLLTLPQALALVYGANVGTTMTSWLVSLVGFGFKIETFALPLIALGTGLLIAAPSHRVRGLGEALAGFGLFFLGLSILRDGLSGLTGSLDVAAFAATGAWNVPIFVGVGFVATMLAQSSSAAIALVLTAAASGLVPLEAAAAAVIGANLGTTSTAAFASIGATPNARRVALGHILFNVLAGAVALVILEPMLWLVTGIGERAGLAVAPAVTLALFHTAVKLMGLALMLPLNGILTRWLSRRFRSSLEDAARPRFLDANVAATPPLALAALRRELGRMHEMARHAAHEALVRPTGPDIRMEERSRSILALGEAVADFVTRLGSTDVPREVADLLPEVLRTTRYLGEAARLAPEIAGLAGTAARLHDDTVRDDVERTLDHASRLLRAAEETGTQGTRTQETHAETGAETATTGGHSGRAAADRLARFERTYQEAKRTLLAAGAVHRLDVPSLERLLTGLSRTRRMADQIAKAEMAFARGFRPPPAGREAPGDTDI